MNITNNTIDIDDGNENLFDTAPFYIMIVAIILSAGTSLILVFVLKDKIYKKSKLTLKIIVAEVVCICSTIWFLFRYKTKDNYQHIYWFSLVYRYFGCPQKDLAILVMDKLNLSLYYAFQSYSIVMSSFICLEVWYSLKYPIAQVKQRINIYVIVTIIFTLLQFILVMAYSEFESSKQSEFISNKIYSIKLGKVFRILLLIAFSFFIVSAFISIFYLMRRFCKKDVALARSQRFKFVAKHCTFVGVYLLFCLPVMINEFLFCISDFTNVKDHDYYAIDHHLASPVFSLIVFFLMPFAMFFVRASETNFNKYLCFLCIKYLNKGKTDEKDEKIRETNIYTMVETMELKKDINEEIFFDPSQPLTSNIYKSLNYEFMICILSGLKLITERKKRKHKRNIRNLIDENTGIDDYESAIKHNIFYKKPNPETSEDANITLNMGQNSYFESQDEENKEEEHQIDDQDAEIHEYCPKVFQEIKNIDGVTFDVLSNSLNINKNNVNMKNIKESEGKSGSFFFFTHDQRFIIKTLNKQEKVALLGNFLKNYYEHLKVENSSLLTRIYGVYDIVIHGVSELSIILLMNLQIFPVKQIECMFDLKGSMIGRFVKKTKNQSKLTALKDKNLLYDLEFGRDKFTMAEDKCAHFLSILNKDIQVLSSNNLMDYSLLFLIVRIPEDTHPDFQAVMDCFSVQGYVFRLAKSQNEKFMFCFGIIDYLQCFNLKKLFENKFKGVLYGSEKNLISAVEPVLYGDRMFNFLRDYLFTSVNKVNNK